MYWSFTVIWEWAVQLMLPSFLRDYPVYCVWFILLRAYLHCISVRSIADWKVSVWKISWPWEFPWHCSFPLQLSVLFWYRQHWICWVLPWWRLILSPARWNSWWHSPLLQWVWLWQLTVRRTAASMIWTVSGRAWKLPISCPVSMRCLSTDWYI